jgi:hypothetical protein
MCSCTCKMTIDIQVRTRCNISCSSRETIKYFHTISRFGHEGTAMFTKPHRVPVRDQYSRQKLETFCIRNTANIWPPPYQGKNITQNDARSCEAYQKDKRTTQPLHGSIDCLGVFPSKRQLVMPPTRTGRKTRIKNRRRRRSEWWTKKPVQIEYKRVKMQTKAQTPQENERQATRRQEDDPTSGERR